METQPKTSFLAEDFHRYSFTHKTFETKAVNREFESWIQQDLSDVVSQLRGKCLSDEVHLLSVGGGAGTLDKKIVQQFLPHFSTITNNVIDPNKYHLATYQSINKLEGVSYDWCNKTFDEFKLSRGPTSRKFHFISAIHSLYYVEEPQVAVSYLYDLLEEGGKLLITMQAEESGIVRLARHFDLLAESVSLLNAISLIRDHLQRCQIDYETRALQDHYDVTSCYQDTDEGYLLLEFITHLTNFKTSVPIQTQRDILKYMKSEECSLIDGEKVLLDAKEVVFVITKSGHEMKELD